MITLLGRVNFDDAVLAVGGIVPEAIAVIARWLGVKMNSGLTGVVVGFAAGTAKVGMVPVAVVADLTAIP